MSIEPNKKGRVNGTNKSDKITWKKSWSDYYSLYVDGKGGNDTINFSASNYTNFIYGGKGNDIIKGGKKEDMIDGGEGNDKIYGNGGGDYMEGGTGKDKMYGGKGNDTIYGGDDNDIIYGQYGKNKLYGDKGNDKIYDGKGKDEIWAGEGNDKIYLKKSKSNTVYLEEGTNTVTCNTTKNTINLGTEKDTIIFDKSSKTATVKFTNSSDYANLKFSGGKVTATKSGSNIIVKCGKNTITVKNYMAKGHLSITSGSNTKNIEEYLPANSGNTFKSFISTKTVDTSELTQEVTAWKTANTSTDMQVLTDANKTNEIPDVTAAFVDTNKTA